MIQKKKKKFEPSGLIALRFVIIPDHVILTGRCCESSSWCTRWPLWRDTLCDIWSNSPCTRTLVCRFVSGNIWRTPGNWGGWKKKSKNLGEKTVIYENKKNRCYAVFHAVATGVIVRRETGTCLEASKNLLRNLKLLESPSNEQKVSFNRVSIFVCTIRDCRKTMRQ